MQTDFVDTINDQTGIIEYVVRFQKWLNSEVYYTKSHFTGVYFASVQNDTVSFYLSEGWTPIETLSAVELYSLAQARMQFEKIFEVFYLDTIAKVLNEDMELDLTTLSEKTGLFQERNFEELVCKAFLDSLTEAGITTLRTGYSDRIHIDNSGDAGRKLSTSIIKYLPTLRSNPALGSSFEKNIKDFSELKPFSLSSIRYVNTSDVLGNTFFDCGQFFFDLNAGFYIYVVWGDDN